MSDKPGLPGRMLAVRTELRRLAAIATNPTTRAAIARALHELDRSIRSLHYNREQDARSGLEAVEQWLESIERTLRTGGHAARWNDRTWAEGLYSSQPRAQTQAAPRKDQPHATRPSEWRAQAGTEEPSATVADLQRKAQSQEFSAAWADEWNPNPLSDVSA